MSDDPIAVYLKRLRRRLRWRRNGGRMLVEIDDHLRAAAADYERQGLSREEAAQTAISRLGSARDMRGHRRGRGVIAITVIAVAFAATMGVLQPWSGAAPGTPGHLTRATRSSPQATLLARIVARVRLGAGSSAVLGAPPRDFKGGVRSWATITTQQGDQSTELLGEWKAGLVAGTFRDLSRTRGLPKFIGYTNGDGSGAGLVGAPDHPALTAHPSVRSVAARLRRVGLTPDSIRLIHPGEGTAVLVVASTTDAAAFLSAHPSPATAIFGDINKYAGTFLEVNDAHGVADISAYASSAGQGALWVRPGLPDPQRALLQAFVAPSTAK